LQIRIALLRNVGIALIWTNNFTNACLY